jgi:hypothetical protein
MAAAACKLLLQWMAASMLACSLWHLLSLILPTHCRPAPCSFQQTGYMITNLC